jgi:hypothetical protein
MLRIALPVLVLLIARDARSDVAKGPSTAKIREDLAARELALEARAVELDRREALLVKREIAAAKLPAPPPEAAPPPPSSLPPPTSDCAVLVAREAERLRLLESELKKLSKRLK